MSIWVKQTKVQRVLPKEFSLLNVEVFHNKWKENVFFVSPAF